MKKCPRCKRENRDRAMTCSCGYSFVGRGSEGLGSGGGMRCAGLYLLVNGIFGLLCSPLIYIYRDKVAEQTHGAIDTHAFGIIAIFGLIISLLNIYASYALANGKKHAITLAMALCATTVLNIPCGTILGLFLVVDLAKNQHRYQR